MEPARSPHRLPGARCPTCREDLGPGPEAACSACDARHHLACWSVGTCGACGANHPPTLEESSSLPSLAGFLGLLASFAVLLGWFPHVSPTWLPWAIILASGFACHMLTAAWIARRR